jgi:Ca-activated chloride channel family protein
MIWTLLLLLIGLIIAESNCRRQLHRLIPQHSYRRLAPARLLTDVLRLLALGLIMTSLQATNITTRDNDPGPAIALVVDVSRSMQVTDLTSNRLTHAKHELLSLLDRLPDARFSLIPFAGEAVLQVPLTNDRDGLRFFINNLHPGLIASPGSAPSEAVLLAQNCLEDVSGERLIILITDGERTIAEQPPLLSDSIPVYSIMTGTTTGGQVGNIETAISRADPKRLSAITEQTGGQILEGDLVTPAVFRLPVKQIASEPTGMISIYLIIALLFLVFRYLPKNLQGRRGFSFTLLLLALTLPSCVNETEPQQTARVQFDQGVQMAKTEDFDEAIRAFDTAVKGLDGRERGIALYNQGTLFLTTGNEASAINLLEQALILMPDDMATRDNLLLALTQQETAFAGDKGRPKSLESDNGQEMTMQQALQLIDSVHLGPTTTPTEATIRPPTVLKEW